MEITEYINFIKDQFKDIAAQYLLSWKQQNEYILLLENHNTKITFATHYRETGITISIDDTKKKKSYNLGELLEILGKESLFDILDNNQKQINEEYKKTIKCLIYPSAILLKTYFPGLLNGNFSSLEK